MFVTQIISTIRSLERPPAEPPSQANAAPAPDGARSRGPRLNGSQSSFGQDRFALSLIKTFSDRELFEQFSSSGADSQDDATTTGTTWSNGGDPACPSNKWLCRLP